MVSNGDLLVAPDVPGRRVARVEALLHHEVGTHVVTYVNGAHQPLHVLASGLAGHDETQEGLAVLAEHLVGGLTAGRLRQLAARVVAVHQMVEGAAFPEVHATLVDAGDPAPPGVHDHDAGVPLRRPHQGRRLPARPARARRPPRRRRRRSTSLWLGKMPLTAVPLVDELHRPGRAQRPAPPAPLPRRPRRAGAPGRASAEVDSLAELIGEAA